MALLTVLAHLFNISSCILSNSWVVPVGANGNVAFIGAKFRVWVGSAIPKTRPWTLCTTAAQRVTHG
jgi:hypothetical protein